MTSTDPQHRDREPAIEWAHPGLHLRFDHGDDHPVRLAHWAAAHGAQRDSRAGRPTDAADQAPARLSVTTN